MIKVNWNEILKQAQKRNTLFNAPHCGVRHATVFGRNKSSILLLLSGLLGGLGDLAGAGILLGDGLDDADGHRLPHVADGEATERRIFGESLHGHGLGRSHLDDGCVSVLDGLGEGFQLFARTTIAPKEFQEKFA